MKFKRSHILKIYILLLSRLTSTAGPAQNLYPSLAPSAISVGPLCQTQKRPEPPSREVSQSEWLSLYWHLTGPKHKVRKSG